MEALKVIGLSKNFGGIWALRDISFSIESGKTAAIIGPNGAGKTTLLNLLSGALKPSSGAIYLLGREVSGMAEYRRVRLGLGRSFQLTNIFFGITVLKNMLAAIKAGEGSHFQMIRAIKYDEISYSKARKLLDRSNLWEKRNIVARDLSYGEQRKLEILLAFAGNPKVLLLDEPTNGLAGSEVNEVVGMISGLSEAGITVVLISHDMDVVFRLADLIIVLHYGELIASGTPNEIRTDPRVKRSYLGA